VHQPLQRLIMASISLPSSSTITPTIPTSVNAYANHDSEERALPVREISQLPRGEYEELPQNERLASQQDAESSELGTTPASSPTNRHEHGQGNRWSSSYDVKLLTFQMRPSRRSLANMEQLSEKDSICTFGQ
jgi:hypothetical protein